MVCRRVLCPLQVSEKTRFPQRIVEPMNQIVISLKLTKVVNIRNKKINKNLSLAMFLLTWYKPNLWKKIRLNQTLNQILNTAYLSKYRLGEERCAIAHKHLSTHLKYILDAPLSHTLNKTTYSAPCSGSKKPLNNSSWPMIRKKLYYS